MKLGTLIARFLQQLQLSKSDVSYLVANFADDSSISACITCNGFYGPNFSQPLCLTCHAFLAPANPVFLWSENAVSSCTQLLGKSESDDSGNEDQGPTDGAKSEQSPCKIAGHALNGSGHDAPRRNILDERIIALTCPRDPLLDKPPSATLLACIPAEVIAKIFGYMDDLSLWCCSRVNTRWLQIIRTETTAMLWQQNVLKRWPLFRPLVAPPICWLSTYGRLVQSTPCLLCLQLVCMPPCANPAEDTTWRSKRLNSELRAIQQEPPEGIEAHPLDRQLSQWIASIVGPSGSPYEGGKFYLLVQVPTIYPMRPPVIRFLTKIFHPNVSAHGDLGLDVLNANWSLALTIPKVLLSIQSLLTDPNVDICMQPSIGKLHRERPEAYRAIATCWTWKYAMVDALVL